MPKIFNSGTTQQNTKDSPLPEYSWRATENLAELSGLKDFACNIRTLDKGKISYPYHYHHNAEELFVILSGEGDLRTPEGLLLVKQGDVVLFEIGETGAHQLLNSHDEPLVYLDLRTIKGFDVCEYPDTGKVNILPEMDIFDRGEPKGYFDGEDNIGEIWKKLITDN